MEQKDFLTYLKKIEHRYNILVDDLNRCKSAEDEEYFDLTKKISEMNSLVEDIKEYFHIKNQIEETQKLILDSEYKEIVELAKEEKRELEKKELDLKDTLISKILPKKKEDVRNAIVEIRAATGGSEATLFTKEILNMYQKYSLMNKWNFEILSVNQTEVGGIKEVICSIIGKGVFSKLKFESGVHRVQRVPETESQGRIHTSTATVAVLQEMGELDIKILDKDIKIETCKSSGAGGQHVNTTDSAVKITHLKTGITVVQQEKSQHKNKERALRILRSRIYDLESSKKNKERADDRKSQLGSGDRSEKIRTYNFPQGRVTDHRIKFTSYKINAIVYSGDLFEMISLLEMNERKLEFQLLLSS